MRNESTQADEVRKEACGHYSTVPISYLSIDLDVPAVGWEKYLEDQGIDVMVDDCGRPAIARSVFAAMFREPGQHAQTPGRAGGATSRRGGRNRTADASFRWCAGAGRNVPFMR